MARFQLISTSSYAKNKLQMCWVTQHRCIRCQMCEKCSHINSLHSLWTVTKNDLSSLNNLFMAKFQLIRMSSYFKNKLQMCSDTQHQCRTSPNLWKMFTISLSTLTLWPLLKTTCPNWTIYSWQGFNSLVCPLMLKTNYRCVQSLNFRVNWIWTDTHTL